MVDFLSRTQLLQVFAFLIGSGKVKV